MLALGDTNSSCGIARHCIKLSRTSYLCKISNKRVEAHRERERSGECGRGKGERDKEYKMKVCRCPLHNVSYLYIHFLSTFFYL